MLHWTDKYRGWEGTAAELADVAAVIEAEVGIPEGDTRPNERLVRHYVHVGIIDRAERRGKEAYFGFRQIVELLAARVLLNDGWPLAKIAEFVRIADLDGLLGLLPKSAPLTPAQELVKRFQRRASAGQLQTSKSASSPLDPMRQSVDLLRQRQEAFADGVQPEVNTWLRIELTPWCHVYIERDAAQRTPPELIERLGRVLTQTLIEFIRRGDRK
jgi:DNA-binding transcriptional MerR regulator